MYRKPVRCYSRVWQLVSTLLLSWLVGITPSNGQQYIYEFQQLKDELAEPKYNWYIHQDQHNMIWLSSTAGLNRYDGEEIKIYRPNRANPNALRSVYASQSQFFNDERGNIWFTEDEAVIRYDYEQDHFDRVYVRNMEGDTLQTGYGWAHLDSLSGLFWFQAMDQLYTCDTRSEKREVISRGLAPNMQRKTMWRDASGQLLLFAATNDSLLLRRYNENLVPKDTFLGIPNEGEIQQIYPQSGQLIWVATTEGLVAFDSQKMTWQDHPGSWAGKTVRGISNLAILQPDRLLVGTSREGIYVYDTKSRRYCGKLRQLKDGTPLKFTPQISTLRVDQDANLWISTSDEGVLFTNLRKPKFKILLPNRSVLGITENHLGQILAVTSEYLYTLNQEEIIDSIPLPIQGRDFENARFIHEDSQQNIWIGTESCLFLKRANTRAIVPFELLPSGIRETQTFTAITELPDGRLVFGNSQNLPFGLSIDLQQSFFLPEAAIATSFVASIDNYLFSYSANNEFRIYVSSNDGFQLDTVLTPLPIVNSISSVSTAKHYLLATDDGLFHLDRTAEESWRLEADGKLVETAINSLLLSPEGSYWIGSPRGLIQYSPNVGTQHRYQKSDGLGSFYFNRAAALAHSDGLLYIGSGGGLTVFDPQKLQSNIPPPRPVISRIRVNQEEANLRTYIPSGRNNPILIDLLQAPFEKNSFSLYLAGREYSGKCIYIYDFRSDSGTETDTLRNTNVLQFSNLREGKYELEIRAVNADGQPSVKSHILGITVYPPWYRSWWFLTLCSLLGLLVVYRIYRYRLKIITDAKNAELAQAAAELKEAEALQKVTRAEQQKAETETAVLRLQMNPHFIFNGLNTIDALILKRDPSKAHDILVQFARLMRRMLDNSEEQLVSINEEVRFLGEYLQLESQRFPDRMTYEFHVDQQLDGDNVFVPTMILQPFVENAIIHGLRPKASKGHIQINFVYQETQNLLICEVRDNGVGRTIHSKNHSHTSKATNITQRRLEVLTSTFELDPPPKLEIIDELHPDGTSAGTTAKLHFPIIE